MRREPENEQPADPASAVMGAGKLLDAPSLPLLLGVAGGAMLTAGAGAPLLHIPIVGTISYLHHPDYFTSYKIGEVVILAAAGLSILASLLRHFKLLWVTGTVAIIQLLATVATFQRTSAEVLAKAERPDLVDPALMWADAVLHHARFEWGIGIVALGAILILAAAAWELMTASRQRRMKRN